MEPYRNEDLPEWWARPRPDTQPTLFPDPVEVALAELRVTREDLRRWHQAGWLSFTIDNRSQLDWPQQNEIRFVRSLLFSGLGETELRRLAQGLPRPLALDSRSIAYSFEYGWVVPTEKDPDDVVEEHLSTWLEGLASSRNIGRLQMLAEQIAEHLGAMSEEGDELEETDSEESP